MLKSNLTFFTGVAYSIAAIMYGTGFYLIAKDADEPEIIKIALSILIGVFWLPIWLVSLIKRGNGQ